MSITTISGIRIAGISCTVPEPSGSIDDFVNTFGQKTVENIQSETGVRRWHTATYETCTSDLCHTATVRLLKDLSWEPVSVGLLVLVTRGSDYGVPSTSCILQNRLGLPKSCAAMDVSHGGAGYIYGLWIISSLMKAGGIKRALLLAGDVIRKNVSSRDKRTALLFGDAGTATALECSDDSAPMTIFLGSDGSGKTNIQIPAGGHRLRCNAETSIVKECEDGNFRSDDHLRIDPNRFHDFALAEVEPAIGKVLDRHGWTKESVDAFLFHQAGKNILDALRLQMELPDNKVPSSLENFGNTSSASIPLTMSQCMGALRGKPHQLIMAGFGSGYSWGTCAITVGPVVMPETIILATQDVPKVELPGE